MTTLRDIWIRKGLTSAQVAGRAVISVTTLYKANRKEDINFSTVKAICEVLGISLEEYDKLEPCGQSDKFRKGKKKS